MADKGKGKAAAAPVKDKKPVAAPPAKKPKANVDKAKATAKAVKQGKFNAVHKKMRTKVHFYRPRTLRLARNPKYQSRALPRQPKLDKFNIIKYPICSESAMKEVEENNTLAFIVDNRANKRQIREAIKALHDVLVIKVRTLIRPDGLKKAYARLGPDVDALDIANRIGIV